MSGAGTLLSLLLLPLVAFAQPTAVPAGFTPAPMPNLNLTAPLPAASGDKQQALFSPFGGQPHAAISLGDGYTPHSEYTTDTERQTHRTGTFGSTFSPTFTVKVPLD